MLLPVNLSFLVNTSCPTLMDPMELFTVLEEGYRVHSLCVCTKYDIRRKMCWE